MIDVLVAGGGPAGLATALYAVRAGLSVVVHEPRTTAPIDKACGEGLMPAAVTALADLGVDPDGLALRGIRYLDGRAVAEADFAGGPGRGVRRTTLHAALREQVVRAGVEIVPTPVRALRQDGTAVHVTGGRPARFVVAADGLHSPLRHALDLDVPSRGPRRYGLRRHFTIPPWTDLVEVHWVTELEAYVTPVGPDCVGVALLTSRREPFERQLAAFGDLSARLEHASYATGGEPARVLGAGPLRQRSRRRTAGRVLLVGDASGYVDALTGEGIALAMGQARAAVEAIRAGRPRDYERSWRRVTRRHAVLTHALLAASRMPPARRRLVPWAARVPHVFDLAVGALSRPPTVTR